MAGYTRQDTQNNIANGNVIDADDFDAEYNALESAFDASSGHKHDGTAGEGAPITKTGPAQEYVSDGTALYPKTDNTYDLGKSGNEWKDLYVDGTANLDSVVADTADINGGTLDNVTVGATTPAAGTFTQVDITARGDLRLQDTTGGEYVALQAPDTVSANVTFTLPGADGTNGQTLVTDGSGNLSFADAASGSVWTESGSDIYYNSGNVGIGTDSPTADLHVSGDIILNGNYPVGSGNFFAGGSAGAAATASVDRAIIIGQIAGDAITSGTDAVIIGQNAVGQATDISSGTIAIGRNSLYAAGIVALGDFGLGNIAIGEDTAVLLGGSASRNVFMGHEAGELLSSVGSYNVVVGAETCASPNSSTILSNNTIVGSQACYEADKVDKSVVIGYQAGYYLNEVGTTRDPVNNVIVGNQAGLGPSSGAGHESATLIGNQALVLAESSELTVAVGHQAGAGLDDTEDATGCVFLGAQAVATTVGSSLDNVICIGYLSAPNASSDEITLGNSSISSLRCNVTTITSLSDERDKSNIQDIPYGLDYINAVRPVAFDWDRRDGSYEGKKDIGFIAQELDQVESEFNSSEYTSLVSKANPEKLEAAPHNLFPILVKAVQELSAEVQSLKTELAELKGS